MKDVTWTLKDRMILLGWVAGLVLIAALLWSLSFPFRSACLMYSTNKTLAAMDDPRRLSAPLLHPFAGPDPLGCWYSFFETGVETPARDAKSSAPSSLFFVFAIMREGILVPCGAEVSEKGEVTEIIPLGRHAQQVMDKIPQGLIQVYVRRIESAAAAMIADASRRGKR